MGAGCSLRLPHTPRDTPPADGKPSPPSAPAAKPAVRLAATPSVSSAYTSISSAATSSLELSFPILTLPAAAVLQLDVFPAHEAASVVAWRREDGPLCFVSHQWLALHHPDPSASQLRVLQRVLSRLLAGELQVYGLRAAEAASLHVWLDFWSVPQDAAAAARRHAAIHSIPAYAAAAAFMLVLCPPATHADSGQVCNYATWERRGWCRLERLAYWMSNFCIDRSPTLLIASSGASVEKGIVSQHQMNAAHQSVFCGDFSYDDDRTSLFPVVHAVYTHAVAAHKAAGEGAAWRKLQALGRVYFHGCHEWRPPPPPPTAAHFLERYGMASVREHAAAGMTALHYAALEDNPATIDLLIAAGAYPDARDSSRFPLGTGATPLLYAALHGASSAVAALLSHRADPNAASLHSAPLVWKLAFAAGAQLSPPAAEACAAAVLAAGGHVDAVATADRGAAGPAWELYGTTPLALAALRGHRRLAALLLEAGARPEMPCLRGGRHGGRTAAELAREGEGGEELAAMVEAAAARGAGHAQRFVSHAVWAPSKPFVSYAE
ncbi:hypothetical protein AB1Y20_016953 [Prymnesium parvum]|uniref:Uncharacterized protein n=1 Tax=Prymnesium parvum TaxID=97485 RepID=A0AB34ICM5_PRYPA